LLNSIRVGTGRRTHDLRVLVGSALADVPGSAGKSPRLGTARSRIPSDASQRRQRFRRIVIIPVRVVKQICDGESRGGESSAIIIRMQNDYCADDAIEKNISTAAEYHLGFG